MNSIKKILNVIKEYKIILIGAAIICMDASTIPAIYIGIFLDKHKEIDKNDITYKIYILYLLYSIYLVINTLIYYNKFILIFILIGYILSRSI